jgi:hypothetical protein
MNADGEDEQRVTTKHWHGIELLFCCPLCWAESAEDVSTSESVVQGIEKRNPEKLMRSLSDLGPLKNVWYGPGLATWPVCYECELSTFETDLSITSTSGTSRKMGDISTLNLDMERKSTWDCFFESQSNILWTNTPENIMLTNYEIGGDDINLDLSNPDLSFTDVALESSKSSKNQPRFGDALTKKHLLPPGNSRRKDEVLFSYYSKGAMRFTYIPQDTHLEDVAKWLNIGSPRSIPICENINKRGLARQKPKTFRKITLSEAFEESLDPERDGITCFIGPVEGRISYKMSVCNREKLQKATRDSQESTFLFEVSR